MKLPRLGMGTWHMGERAANRPTEVAALRLGLDLGITLIDTAEMYGDGGAEEVVGEAIRGRRGEVILVSKFYPHHASRRKLVAACDASLARLGTEFLDLYLYHWRGSVPLEETVAALEELEVPGGKRCAADQVCYNLAKRGIEFDLLPWCDKHGVAPMAYSPLDEGRLVRHPVVVSVAKRLGVSAAQLALAWILRDARICAIPKASSAEHVRANRDALEIKLDAAASSALDAAFPPPRRKQPLALI
jgi:diketogulonate reductase-like aldo/keto reductase